VTCTVVGSLVTSVSGGREAGDEETGEWVEGGVDCWRRGRNVRSPYAGARARFVHNIIHTVPVSKTEERDRGLNCVPSNFLRR
jgi:hypothetical protein